MRAAALLDFIRANQRFALVVCCEAICLLTLLCQALFTPLRSLSVSPADFDANGRTSVLLTEDPRLVVQEDAKAPNGYSLDAGPYQLGSGGYKVTVRYRSDVDGSGGVNKAADAGHGMRAVRPVPPGRLGD